MPETGLRELKKARTRQLIAATAARLFAEHGYEQVSVGDVARAAEVSEQTVYNYFSTKEQLVTDLDPHIQDKLSELIRARPADITPAAAIRAYAIGFVDAIRQLPAERVRGELGYLAAVSPAVHRLSLEMSERQAITLAEVIAETSTISPWRAALAGIAIAGIFQIIVRESGRRAVDGQAPDQIADELLPAVAGLIDELDHSGLWTT